MEKKKGGEEIHVDEQTDGWIHWKAVQDVLAYLKKSKLTNILGHCGSAKLVKNCKMKICIFCTLEQLSFTTFFVTKEQAGEYENRMNSVL